jgi:hypothetical protein
MGPRGQTRQGRAIEALGESNIANAVASRSFQHHRDAEQIRNLTKAASTGLTNSSGARRRVERVRARDPGTMGPYAHGPLGP